ncbi:MAG: nuclear transport factor 2 family protein [Ferruginibacter sp.]
MEVKTASIESDLLSKESELIIRNLYAVAETQDSKKFAQLFTEDGTINDTATGVIYKGYDEIAKELDVYSAAFPDMHRELYSMYVLGDIVIVELSLNGTHNGPLVMPSGTIPATGKEIHAPCCDVFRIREGKVFSFNCYAAGSVILAQIGVF